MGNNKYVLECCADSYESAFNAYKGGADRLELCGNLVIGGTTPSLYLFEEIRNNFDIKMHILIRPRFGDFLYSEYEKNIMKKEIISFREAGAEGVVIGALTKEGELNMEIMKELIDAAGDMKVVLHRAFDVSKDPFNTLEKAISLGIDTILTSGQQANSLKGIELIKKLSLAGGDKLKIMPGGGVTANVIEKFLNETDVTCFHMSAKKIIKSEMEFKNPNVSMGIDSLSEYEIFRTDEEKIREACNILRNFV